MNVFASPHLLEEIIGKPYRNGYRTLYVVTGYASAAFVSYLFYQYPELVLNMIVGMAKHDASVSIWDHNEYLQLFKETQRGTVSYYIGPVAVHAKVFLWQHPLAPSQAFVGSANLTWNGFRNLNEVMTTADPHAVDEYFHSIHPVMSAFDRNIFDYLSFSYQSTKQPGAIDMTEVKSQADANPFVTLPLTDRTGDVPKTSGLNWGQRPGREPNQAYISIPAAVHRQHPEFFPPPREEFTLITNDGYHFICVVAQDNNKALETRQDNSILGKYFRKRLRVPLGQPVTINDLEKYGRNTVTIHKLNDDTYYLTF